MFALIIVVHCRCALKRTPLQRAPLLCTHAQVFATGGQDGTLRLWQCSHISPSASASSLVSEPSAASPTMASSRATSRSASRSASPTPGAYPTLPTSPKLAPPKVPTLDAQLVGLWRLCSPLTCLLRFGGTPLVVAGEGGVGASGRQGGGRAQVCTASVALCFELCRLWPTSRC